MPKSRGASAALKIKITEEIQMARAKRIKDVPSALRWLSGWLNDLKEDWEGEINPFLKQKKSGDIIDMLKIIEKMLRNSQPKEKTVSDNDTIKLQQAYEEVLKKNATRLRV